MSDQINEKKESSNSEKKHILKVKQDPKTTFEIFFSTLLKLRDQHRAGCQTSNQWHTLFGPICLYSPCEWEDQGLSFSQDLVTFSEYCLLLKGENSCDSCPKSYHKEEVKKRELLIHQLVQSQWPLPWEKSPVKKIIEQIVNRRVVLKFIDTELQELMVSLNKKKIQV